MVINQLLLVGKLGRCPPLAYLADKGPNPVIKVKFRLFPQLQYNVIDWCWVNKLGGQMQAKPNIMLLFNSEAFLLKNVST